MAYAGIDYGMGRSNVDTSNGIRYGVISQHTIGQAWYDSAEPDYGKPTCPKCGNEATTFDTFEGDAENFDKARGECDDFCCTDCEYIFGSESAYGDEPRSWNYSGDGYELTDCLDVNVFVLKAPYYTFARFCSPCVPGAGDLDSTEDGAAKTYALGHDWFEDGKAPYPVYSVETDKLVEPDAH